MEDKFSVFNEGKIKAEKLTKIGIGVLIFAVILFIILSSTISQDATMVLSFIVGIVGFIFIGIGSVKFRKLSKSFKYDVLVKLFEESLPGTVYNPDAGLSQMDVYGTEFIKTADRFYTEDLITGSIENVDFISSDVRLEERHVEQTKNGTRVYYVPYFIGRIFKFNFNKEFEGYLQVLESGSPISKHKFEKVKLESIDFNKKFKTYATTELSAFYVLTPDIIEAIMHLEKANPGRIGLSFTGETLYIAINNNKDTFELKMFKPIDNSIIEEFKKDLLVIKDVIVALKLNNNLFKK
ncbi:MAG: DUF3137 domain-containing protein [Candidatus Izemoplasmatales bacterium]|jgi:hypothetical protein|nr:DUF3137 domain-containing protein [Candidatus Izemoplasmatales bacterium]